MRIKHAIGIGAVAMILTAVFLLTHPTAPTAAGKPAPNFMITETGEVICQDDEDACVYSERIIRPSGDWYLVQGSHTRKEYEAPNPQFHDDGLVSHPFAYLCRREGDRLIPFHDFLENGEKVATVDVADLDKDGILEIAIAASEGLDRSYVKVFRVSAETPEEIFEAISDTSYAVFEKSGTTYRISVEAADRSAPQGKKSFRFHRRSFDWDGRAFRLVG